MKKKISDYKCPKCGSEMTVSEFYEFNTHECTKCDYYGDQKVRSLPFITPYDRMCHNIKK
jgi:ribosomal protein L37E